MIELPLVVWDDVPGQAARIGRAVMEAWHKRDPETTVTSYPVEVFDVDAVVRTIRDSGATLFVCDIIRKTVDANGAAAEEPSGLELIRAARAHFPNLAILAVTAGLASMGEAAEEVGACDWKSRNFFFGPLDQLFTLTERLLVSKGTRPHPYDESVLVTPNPEDLPLVAAIASAGALRIVYFASRLVGKCERIEASFVKSGLSGASVLSLECTPESADGEPVPSVALLLKMADCESVIAREVQKRYGMRHFEDCFVPVLDTPAIAFSDWFAVGSKFRRGAMTLQDWLVRSQPQPTAAQLGSAFSRLFLKNRLAHTYGTTKATGKPVSDEIRSILNVGRAARVMLAMKELEDLTKEHLTEVTYDIRLIHEFVRQPNRIGQVDTTLGGATAQTCWSHGDLHDCNILYSPDSESLHLIDPGSIAVLHWAADPARLVVDLMVSAWGAGHTTHRWDQIDDWLNAWHRILSRDQLDDPKGASAVELAIGWLLHHLPQYCSAATPERAWEFSAMLGVEMLRSSYRNCELSAPKRVFALAAATAAIRKAEAQYGLKAT